MTSQTTGPDEQRLAEVLRQEAERVVVADDTLARIRARVASPASTPELPRRVHPPARTRRGLLAGAAVAGLAAAVTLVVGLGLHPDASPQPVETPGPLPSAAPTYDAQPGRNSLDVYRVRTRADGRPLLAIETIPVTPPLQPRQALDALFHERPLEASDHSVLDDGGTVVASTREEEAALVVDLAAVDEGTRADSRAVADLWVQAWVHTLQSAYASDKPVLITLHGRPLTLYGQVDTRRPIAATDVPTTQDQRIFVPRPGQRVTSPVTFGANLPAGTYIWRVRDQSGRLVDSTGVEGETGGYQGPAFDLPPGRYRASVSAEAGTRTARFASTVDFEVTGPAPDAAPHPVTDPPVTVLATTAVYYASSEGPGLVRERRTRHDPAVLLEDYLATAPSWSGTEASALRPARVRSVTVTGDRVVVDLATLPRVPAGVAASSLRRQAAAFVRTVQSVTSSRAPVAVTLGGAPATFLGQRVLVAPTGRDARVSERDDPFPQTPHDPGRAEVVGRLREGRVATWSLADAVTQRTLFQGTVPPADATTGVYAFAVDAPPGRYLLSVTSRKGVGRSGTTTDVELVVR